MARIRVAASLTAIFAFGLAVQAAAGPTTVSYVARKRYIKMAMLLVPESRKDNNPDNPGYNNSDPWMPYLLNVSPMKPAGWEFINSLAKPIILGDTDLIRAGNEYKNLPHKGGGWFNWYSGPNNSFIGQPATPDKPAYWVVKLSDVTAEDLAKFDLLLIVAHHRLYFSDRERDLLARAVDAGAVLWIDNSRFSDGMQLRNFFLQPRVDFHLVGEDPPKWMKSPVDITHPLLNGVYQITPEQVADIGDRAVDDRLLRGVVGYKDIDHGLEEGGRPHNWAGHLFEVIHNRPHGASGDTGAPAVAAGPYGSGYVILSACNIAARINDWWEFGNIANGQNPAVAKPRADAPPPIESQGAFGFAYNVVYWATMWRAEHRAQRHSGSVGYELAPPLTEMWEVPVSLEMSRAAASAIINRRVLLTPSCNGLWAFDTTPPLAANPYGPIDDGIVDYLLGAPFDRIADPMGVGRVVGSPAVATIYDPNYPRPGTDITGAPRELAYVVTRDGADSAHLRAFYVDPMDPNFDDSPWSQSIDGGVNSGPLYSRGLVYMATLWNRAGATAAKTARILAFDAATGGDPVAEVAINELAGGAAKLASLPSPLATATVTMWGTPGNRIIGQGASVPVEILIVAGNAMPLAGVPSYPDFGRLWVVPLRIRAQVPNWTGQGLQVWDCSEPPQLIPAIDAGMPNYVMERDGNSVIITFTRWSLFREYHYIVPQPAVLNSGLTVRYPVAGRAQGTIQEQRHLPFLTGDAVNLGAPVARYPLSFYDWQRVAYPADAVGWKAPPAAPCVVGTDAYVVTDSAVSESPEITAQPHIYGGVTQVALLGGSRAQPQWRFAGDRTPFAADPNYSHYSDFPFSPTYANDSLYVVGNYSFRVHLETGAWHLPHVDDPISVLYALEPKPPTMLMQIGADGECTYLPKVHAYPMDREAPADRSASPNFNERNAAVWLSSDAGYEDAAAPGPELPPTTIDRTKYYVEFETGEVRLDPTVFGEYTGRQLHIQYFVGGVLQHHNMCVPDMVKWRAYFRPEPEDATTWYPRICTPAVAVDGHIYVGVAALNNQDPAAATVVRGYLYAFKDTYPQGAMVDAGAIEEYEVAGTTIYPRAWRHLLGEWPATGKPVLDCYAVSPPAIDGTRLFVSTARGDPLQGSDQATLHCLANARTIIADNYRLLEVDQGGRAQWAAAGTNVVDPSNPSSDLVLNFPGEDDKVQTVTNYLQQPLSRVSKVRRVAGDRWLVCDTGNNRVIEMDRQGNVVWQYPDSDIANLDIGEQYWTVTPESERLLMPKDARRYSWQVDNTYYELTLIADAGNYRVVEIIRPYPDGRYNPASSPQTFQVVAGRDMTLGATTVKMMFLTAEYWQWSGAGQPSGPVLCGVADPPPAPSSWIGHQFAALVKVEGSTVLPAFAPRPFSSADFWYTVDTEMSRDPETRRWQTVMVDAVGVKVIDNDSWPTYWQPGDDYPDAVFEVVASTNDVSWLDTGDDLHARFAAYDEEIAGITAHPLYSTYQAGADAYRSHAYFCPVAAKRLANGRLLVVNGDSRLFDFEIQATPTPITVFATKSEVFELDIRLRPDGMSRLQRGQRLFTPDGDYFLVPNPLTGEYPDIAGKSYNLKQPLFADRY